MSAILYDNTLIPHARVVEKNGRYDITMYSGCVFYDLGDYIDENGEMYEPQPYDIYYSRYGNYPTQVDIANRLVVVDESTVNPNQIF